MNVYTLVKNLLVSQIFNSLYHFITSADFGLQSLEFEPLQSSNLFGTKFLMAIFFQHVNIVENVSHVVQQWKNMKRVSVELESPSKKIEN